MEDWLFYAKADTHGGVTANGKRLRGWLHGQVD